ncbi:MAG TPA: hypothetical protein GXZ27_10770 [Thermoanaerobacterales bacterium]|jgi:predicted  nucleic acid-binding Zn-ribbon protein|nr:hypothetical protein [Thermoanaerobacterales bacterium]
MIKDELSNLFKLQEIEDRCELLKQTLKSHPDLKRLCKLKKDVSETQEQLQDKNKRIHFLENELRQAEQIIDKYYTTAKQAEERIYGGEVTTVKELKILEQKRNSAQLKVEEYEEKALEIMEELDYLQANLPKNEEMANKKKKEYNEKRLKTRREIDRIKNELTMIIKQKQQLETGISSELLDKYHRIRRFKRDPVALVSDGKCNGCMMDVSVMIALEVERHESLIYCENCGRILV